MPDDTMPNDTPPDDRTEPTIPGPAGTLLVVREPFRGFAKGEHLAGEAADAVLASEHIHHVVVLRRSDRPA